MSTRPSTPRSLPHERPQSDPKMGSGVVGGGEQLALQLRETGTISQHIDGIYQAFQQAVERAGGVVWLAASMEKPLPGVSLKVRHAPDSKGETQRATLDMLGHVGADPGARLTFLAALCDLWGCEPPELKRIATTEEKYEALLAEIEDANGVGKSIVERAARRLGTDAGAFRRSK